MPASLSSAFILPDPHDIEDTIVDCLVNLRSSHGASASGRARIVENCITPVSLLFKAAEMASAAGAEEQAVFTYFLSLMHAQAAHFPAPSCPD
jgi:hypothetical protein